MDIYLSCIVCVVRMGDWLGDVFLKTSFGQLMININDDVFMERTRQNEKWGWQRHDHGKWLSIAMEEVGESCQALNRINFPNQSKETDKSNLYEELIQAAAVFSAWAEQVREEMENEN